MKPYFSVIIFIVLSLSSVITGTDRYIDTKDKIESDLTNALNLTLKNKSGQWITTDTIRAYRQLQRTASGHVAMLINDKCFTENLSIPQLRDKSYISFDIINDSRQAHFMDKSLAGISGDTIIISPRSAENSGISIAFRAHAECSFATIFSMSDQKLPAFLSFMAVLWAMLSFAYSKRKHDNATMQTVISSRDLAINTCSETLEQAADNSILKVGNMSFNSRTATFHNQDNTEIRLTPMQSAIMEMFFRSENNRLTKAEICDALWPKKENASETLYTLIRRLKPVIEKNSNIKIEVERGKAYKISVEKDRP